jgi:AraC-like DNA-binding protein
VILNETAQEIELEKRAHRKGAMLSFPIASGLNLHIADFVSSETIEQRFATATPVLRFYFHMLGSGYWDLRSPCHGGSQSRVAHGDRISSILFYPEMEGKIYLPMERRQYHLSIYITPSRLNTYLGGRLDSIPEDLQAISEGRMDRGYLHTGPLSQMMHQAVHNLLNCPYTGPMKTLYLETKAMELIVHKLSQTLCEDNGRDRPLKLSRHETDRLCHAREILCRDLENPPTLFDLAHAVGTNHCRLNAGFREYYGTTVFDYLRQKRLNEARRLMEEEAMNVTEAALRVGYNSISSFSKAFSGHFGLSPMKFRKRRG